MIYFNCMGFMGVVKNNEKIGNRLSSFNAG